MHKRRFYEEDELSYEVEEYEDDEKPGFARLYDETECPWCGDTSPFVLKQRGYCCSSCRKLVLPHNE